MREDESYEIPPPAKTYEELVEIWGLRVQAYKEHLKQFEQQSENQGENQDGN